MRHLSQCFRTPRWTYFGGCRRPGPGRGRSADLPPRDGNRGTTYQVSLNQRGRRANTSPGPPAAYPNGFTLGTLRFDRKEPPGHPWQGLVPRQISFLLERLRPVSNKVALCFVLSSKLTPREKSRMRVSAEGFREPINFLGSRNPSSGQLCRPGGLIGASSLQLMSLLSRAPCLLC